jgi:addiction module RelE/StbE family toxin
MHKLRINPLALKDLLEIKEYIENELHNSYAAARLITGIIESYEKLKEYPMLGSDLSSRINISTDFRLLVTGNYIIFYKFDIEYVSIYRILYAKRDYLKIIFKDEEFETN